MINSKIYNPDTTLRFRSDMLYINGSMGLVTIQTQDESHMKLLFDKINEALKDEIFASVKAPHVNKLVPKPQTPNNE